MFIYFYLSDNTFGWNGGMAGYSLYHYHFTNRIEEHTTSFLMVWFDFFPSILNTELLILNMKSLETNI